MFTFFAQFWVLAFFLHHSEDWRPVSITVIGMLLVLWINQVKEKSFPFFISLIFFFCYNFSKSPHLANHANYYMLICFCLLIWAAHSWWRHRDLTEANLIRDFEGLRPMICMSLFVIYFMSGFHKLNLDFFDPEVSCASDFFLRYSREYGFSENLIPAFVIRVAPYFVIFLEIAGALLLLSARAQIFGILSFVGLHSYLIPLSFYDFASICYSILLCFLPSEIYKGEENRARLQQGMTFLVATAISGSLVASLMIDFDHESWIRADVAQGWFFLLGTSYFIYQIYKNISNCGMSPWRLSGLQLFDFREKKSRWMMAMPVLLLVYTSTSYLGLRTAGNTSMFSNLRTEGGESNHLLIGSRWQPFGYQKDLIFIEEVDQKHALWMRGQPKKGMKMTAFELRRITEMWKNEGESVRMAFRHGGTNKFYEDITQSKEWGDRPLPWILKKLMLFREIQPKGPNECRW